MKPIRQINVDMCKGEINMSTSKALTRSNSSRMLAGVCGGLGEFLDIDPTIVRLAFVLGFFISGGTALLVYLVMALIVPSESSLA